MNHPLGLVHCLNIEAYHASPGISKSGLDDMDPPARYYALHLDPKRPAREQTASQRAGQLAHCAILEPEEFGELCAAIARGKTDEAMDAIGDMTVVLTILAARGYDARWTCVPASAAGAPHYRDRWWCLAERADADSERELQPEECESEKRGWTGNLGEDVAYTSSEGLQTGRRSRLEKSSAETGPRMEHESKRCCTDVADAMLLSQQGEQSGSFDAQERAQSGERQAGSRGNGVGWWAVEPGLDRVANGVPNRAHRIKAIGNAQVPIQAALAWMMLGGPCENP